MILYITATRSDSNNFSTNIYGQAGDIKNHAGNENHFTTSATNEYPRVLERKNNMKNNIRERLQYELLTRFNNDVNSLAQYLNCPADMVVQILNGDIEADPSMLEKLNSQEFVQIGQNSKMIFGGGKQTNYFDSNNDKSELHALRLKIKCLEELISANEKHLENMRADHLREIETLKSIVDSLKNK